MPEDGMREDPTGSAYIAEHTDPEAEGEDGVTYLCFPIKINGAGREEASINAHAIITEAIVPFLEELDKDDRVEAHLHPLEAGYALASSVANGAINHGLHDETVNLLREMLDRLTMVEVSAVDEG